MTSTITAVEHRMTEVYRVTATDKPTTWDDNLIAMRLGPGWVGLYRHHDRVPEDALGSAWGWELDHHINSMVMRERGLDRLDTAYRGWWLSGVTPQGDELDWVACSECHRMHAAGIHGQPETAVQSAPAPLDEVQVAVLRDRLAQAEKDLADFKARVVEVSGQYAQENDMCGVYDECMSELGLPSRNTTHEIEIEVTLRTTITAYGQTKEIAVARLTGGDVTVSDDWQMPSFVFTDTVRDDYLTTEAVNDVNFRVIPA